MKSLSLQLNQDYKSFPHGFSYTFEGNLIILSGVNGSGKSQLIDSIAQRESDGNRKSISTVVKLDGVQITRHDILRRSFKQNVGVPELTQARTESVNSHKQQAWSAYQQYRLNFEAEPLWDYKGSAERAKKILLRKFGEQKFNNGQITDLELKLALPPDFVWKSDDIFTNFIGELFFNYAVDVHEAAAQAGLTNTNFDPASLPTPPWKQLNDLFSELGFEYRFKENYFVERFQINEQPSLYQLKNDGTLDENDQRKLADLSDGEKAIISLSFASLSGVKQEDRPVLLLDEYDANFNPSLTEAFYTIINEYFVSKGILVIIATHSPTTISLAPEFTAFYEVFKSNTGDTRILPVEKNDYQELKIANKDFYAKIANQSQRINELQTKLDELERLKSEIRTGTIPLIVTEGKTDVAYIKKTKEKLHITNCEVELYEIIEDRGDSRLKAFLENIAKLPHTRKIIGIFDRDVPSIVNNVERGRQQYKDYGNNVYAFCLPVLRGRESYTNISIEFYYKDEDLKKEKNGKRLYFDNEINFDSKRRPLSPIQNPADRADKKIADENIGGLDWIHSKARFAELVASDEDFTRDFDFTNFRLIFDRIAEILTGIPQVEPAMVSGAISLK